MKTAMQLAALGHLDFGRRPSARVTRWSALLVAALVAAVSSVSFASEAPGAALARALCWGAWGVAVPVAAELAGRGPTEAVRGLSEMVGVGPGGCALAAAAGAISGVTGRMALVVASAAAIRGASAWALSLRALGAAVLIAALYVVVAIGCRRLGGPRGTTLWWAVLFLPWLLADLGPGDAVASLPSAVDALARLFLDGSPS
ncbi:MAG: hypothetical protein AAGN82_21065 [Myxococcota bacterium]